MDTDRHGMDVSHGYDPLGVVEGEVKSQPYDESWTRAPRTGEEERIDHVQIRMLVEGLLKRRKFPAVVLEERETEGRLPIFRPV